MHHLADAPVQNRKHLFQLFARAVEGRAEREPVRIEAAQEAIRQCPLADAHAEGGGSEAFLRFRIFDKLDALKQSLAANVADDAVFLCQTFEAGSERLALLARVAAQVAFQDLAQHGDARGAGERVALERVALDETGILAIGPQKASAIGSRQIIAESGA